MANGQLNLSPMEVRKSERDEPAFRKSEHEAQAARFFDIACMAAHLESKEIAFLCGDISVSLVDKWRSPESRGCPSFAQLLMLPARFHIELHRAMNAKFGFGRQALRDLLEAAGTLALVTER